MLINLHNYSVLRVESHRALTHSMVHSEHVTHQNFNSRDHVLFSFQPVFQHTYTNLKGFRYKQNTTVCRQLLTQLSHCIVHIIFDFYSGHQERNNGNESTVLSHRLTAYSYVLRNTVKLKENYHPVRV